MMTEAACRIRQFRFPQDVPAARALWQNSAPGVHIGRSDEPSEIARKLQRDPDLFLVAEVDGILVGTVIGGYDGRRGMVYHLAVDQAYQGLGIGGALMAEVERLLTLKGCMKAYLMVTPQNLKVIDFYSRRGWEPMPITILAKELR